MLPALPAPGRSPFSNSTNNSTGTILKFQSAYSAIPIGAQSSSRLRYVLSGNGPCKHSFSVLLTQRDLRASDTSRVCTLVGIVLATTVTPAMIGKLEFICLLKPRLHVIGIGTSNVGAGLAPF